MEVIIMEENRFIQCEISFESFYELLSSYSNININLDIGSISINSRFIEPFFEFALDFFEEKGLDRQDKFIIFLVLTADKKCSLISLDSCQSQLENEYNTRLIEEKFIPMIINWK